MFPLRDVIPSRTTPVVTVAIIILNAVITMGEHRKSVGDGDLRRMVERVRGGDAPAPSGPAHPETVGYGHGV